VREGGPVAERDQLCEGVGSFWPAYEGCVADLLDGEGGGEGETLELRAQSAGACY
jgi:hypothetical protein